MIVVLLLSLFASATYALPPLNMRLNVTDIGTLPPLEVRFNLTSVPTARHTMAMPPMDVHVGFNRTLPVNVAFTTLKIPTIQFQPLQVATEPIALDTVSFRSLLSCLARALLVAAMAWHAAKWMFISLCGHSETRGDAKRHMLINETTSCEGRRRRSWVSVSVSFLGLATSAVLAVFYV